MSESTQKCPSCSETVPLEYSVCPFCGFGLLEYELRKFSFKPSLKEVFIRLYNFFRHPFRTSEEIAVATETKGANIILLLLSLFLSLRFFVVLMKFGIGFDTIIQIPANPEPDKWSMIIPINLLVFFVALLLMPLVIWLMFKVFIFITTWFMAKFAAMLGSDATTKQFRSIIGYSLGAITAGELLGILFMLFIDNLEAGTSYTFSDFSNHMATVSNGVGMWIYRVIMLLLWLAFIVYSSIALRTIGKMAWVNAFVAIAVPIALFVYFFYFAGLLPAA
ncbi:MAG: zinc ribbon domain-containing protein [Candidatus Heimdallarchaeota archaeon]|nr:zinc ribbon domain-containing protein [Candidatus Heimdallarchaeota archaeon]